MSENKRSFILHKDSLSILDKMTDEQAGILFKSIYQYQITGELPELDFAMEMAIAPFINQFVRDSERYEQVVEKRKIAGKKGGLQKVANASNSNQVLANDSKTKQDVANVADSDSVSKNESKKESNSNIIEECSTITDEINRSLVAGEKDIKEIAMELAEGNRYGVQREAIMKEHVIKKIEVFKWALSLFNRHKRSNGQLTATHRDYSFHLNNWLRKQDIQAIHQDYYQELKRQTEKQ
jgi:hypothetical protein